ncbi:allophanate hydrolase subunit 1 [Agromyces intestinalis]|uniref:Allophanate hydrolase subunit 1 n=1 Tax=Agromyces intestinalis TaxID=2592652 RepID=A0A5C1YG44_9MICO|nr:allophanate hydrolase subunit 1 [Agromyces intestinalis]QEO15114.1 allophanate hydrolase subunit 1 [Agromyces intestinalis]
MTRRILPSGEHALLVECADLPEVLALHDALDADRPAGLVELVPAARTVLVVIDPLRLPLESAERWIRRTVAGAPGGASGASGASGATGATAGADASVQTSPEPLVVPVVYDGPDLAETAASLGVTPDELVARHTSTRWRVAFIGFAPGFGYLVGDGWPFEVPRLASPRTRVPAGSVGLAGAFTGAYPRETPGGWRLIGRTESAVWDPTAAVPALLVPGRSVRFERVGA